MEVGGRDVLQHRAANIYADRRTMEQHSVGQRSRAVKKVVERSQHGTRAAGSQCQRLSVPHTANAWSPPHGGVDRNIGMSHGLGPKIRPQPPLPHQSNLQLMVRFSTIKLRYFNTLQLGAETPIAPGRGENRPFGERFGRSFHSRSPECTAQTPGKLGVFQAVSPAESGSPLGWWRRIGNWDRTVSGRRGAGRW